VERGRRAFGAAPDQVPKGKLSVKCRRRAKGDFVGRGGAERGGGVCGGKTAEVGGKKRSALQRGLS